MISLCADLGGTRIKLGIVRSGELVAQTVIDAESRGGLGPRLDEITRSFDLLREKAQVTGRVDAVGMAFPCLVEPKTARILSGIDKYPDAVSIDLHKWAREKWSAPIAIDNDANAALAGEWQFGAGRGCRSCVIMTLGTGIGTSAVIDGVPLRGQHGQAGCLGGHFVLNVDGEKCLCGNIGCLETEASTWALPKITRAHPDFTQSALSQEPAIDYAAVFRLADAGDTLATELRDRSIRVWSAGAVNLVHAYDPEIVILTGGIMKSPGPIVERMQSYIDEHGWIGWGKVKVVPGELGDGAALLGMSYLANSLLAGTA